MNQITFSVIIPTYHRNKLLAKCLDCLSPVTQTLPAKQYEVIITDDGVLTTAEEMIKQDYTWVKWVKGPQKGPAANRNSGARYAQGERLVFLDDDCEPDKDILNEYFKAITDNPKVFVFGGSVYCNETIKSPLYASPINLTGSYLPSGNFCIEKDLFYTQQGFDENFKSPHLEDTDFHFRLKQMGIPIMFIKEASVNHPPRLIANPKKISEDHKNWFYYQKKIGMPKRAYNLLFLIFRGKIRHIINSPYSKDSIVSFKNLIVELWHTTLKYGVTRKYE